MNINGKNSHNVEFPESEFFSKNLFDEKESEDYLTSYMVGTEQREVLNKALQRRQKRSKMNMPPSYRSAAEKIRLPANHERNSETNNWLLAMSLEKFEKELKLKANRQTNTFPNYQNVSNSLIKIIMF